MEYSSLSKGNVLWSFYYDVGDNKALCQICKKHISYKGCTTSNLKRHLQRVHSVNVIYSKSSTESQNAVDNLISSEAKISNDVGSLNRETRKRILDDETDVFERTGDAVPQDFEKKSRKKSNIWNLFTQLENSIAKCNFCEKLLSFKGGSTGNLVRHIRNRHNKYKDVITTEDHSHYTASLKNAPCHDILEDSVEVRNFSEEVNIKQCQLLNLDLEIKKYESAIARTELEISKVKLDLLTAGIELD